MKSNLIKFQCGCITIYNQEYNLDNKWVEDIKLCKDIHTCVYGQDRHMVGISVLEEALYDTTKEE